MPPTTTPKIVAPVPRWRQIANYLRQEILTGRYPAGQPLPSEEILAGEFAVSRPTIRQGIATLATEGLVTVRRPYGTIVRDPHARPANLQRRSLTRSSDGYAEPDAPTWTDIGEPVHLRIDATVAHADLLGVQPGQPLATREVLQQAADGTRRAVRLHLPFTVAAKLAAPWATDGRLPAPSDLYGWLAGHGHRLGFTEYIRARMPVGDETQALHMATGVPLLVIARVVDAGQPLALEEIRTPADHTELAYPLPITTAKTVSGTSRAPKPARTRTSNRKTPA